MTAVSVNGSILKLVWTSERSNPISPEESEVLSCAQTKCGRVFPGIFHSGSAELKPMMSLTAAILFSIMALGSFSTSRFLYSRYSTRSFVLVDLAWSQCSRHTLDFPRTFESYLVPPQEEMSGLTDRGDARFLWREERGLISRTAPGNQVQPPSSLIPTIIYHGLSMLLWLTESREGLE